MQTAYSYCQFLLRHAPLLEQQRADFNFLIWSFSNFFAIKSPTLSMPNLAQLALLVFYIYGILYRLNQTDLRHVKL